MKADEYLENVFKDAFKRELEVDENVARTLPFFAATLALVVTLYGYAATKLPNVELRLLSLFLHGLLLGGAVCLAGVVYSLFQAVRAREYRIPPKETELVTWADGLKIYYAEQGLEDAALEEKVTSELRGRMIAEYAEGAEHNRQANVPKLGARAQGFTLLVAALGIAFLMIAIIFTTDRIGSAGHARDPHEKPPRQATHRAAAPDVRATSTAPAAEAASAAGGGQISGRPSGEHGEQVTAPANKLSGSAQQPQPAKPTSPPPAPAHQLLKKSVDGGGPIKGR